MLSSLCCWLRQCWRRCVGCCVVVTVQKKKTKSVLTKKKSREGFFYHYDFNWFKKSCPASNYWHYGFNYFEKAIKSAPRVSVVILAQMVRCEWTRQELCVPPCAIQLQSTIKQSTIRCVVCCRLFVQVPSMCLHLSANGQGCGQGWGTTASTNLDGVGSRFFRTPKYCPCNAHAKHHATRGLLKNKKVYKSCAGAPVKWLAVATESTRSWLRNLLQRKLLTQELSWLSWRTGKGGKSSLDCRGGLGREERWIGSDLWRRVSMFLSKIWKAIKWSNFSF